MTNVGLLVLGERDSLEMLFLLILFLIIIIAAYYVTYVIARVQKGTRTNKNLEIIEVISLGQSKYLELIRIGTQYVVVSVTKQHIETVLTLTKEELVLLDDNQKQKILPFQQILEKYKTDKEKDVKDCGDENDETNDK
ncbi:flagellar biosynthetic protein FliO [Vallitaleaceae bacterium 9-2]